MAKEYPFRINLQDLPNHPNPVEALVWVEMSEEEVAQMVDVVLEIRFRSIGRLFEHDDEYYITLHNPELIARVRARLMQVAPALGWEAYMPYMDDANIALPDEIWDMARQREDWTRELEVESSVRSVARESHLMMYETVEQMWRNGRWPQLVHNNKQAWLLLQSQDEMHFDLRCRMPYGEHVLDVCFVHQHYCYTTQAGIGFYYVDGSSDIAGLKEVLAPVMARYPSLKPELEKTDEHLLYISYESQGMHEDLEWMCDIIDALHTPHNS